MRQTEVGEKCGRFNSVSGPTTRLGVVTATRNFLIDTPGRIVRESRFMGHNFFMANKVELVDLDKKPAQATWYKNPKRCLSLSPQLSSSSSSSTSTSTSPSHQQLSIGTKRTGVTLSGPLSNLSNTSSRPLIMSRASSTATSESTYEYLLVDPKKIHLFVKAGQDGRSQGACPFCQDVFLQLLIKAQTNKFNFDVISINLDNPPKEFKELCIKPPVLIHGSTKLIQESTTRTENGEENLQTNAVILSDVDEIAEYLDKLYPNSKLTHINSEAKKVCLNVFSKFSFFIRDVASKSTALEAELEKIDTYLRENCPDGEFLNGGPTMTQLDCSLLPKLQHIRVAGESIKKFRIPHRFRHLWKYIQRAYETDAFQKSCPPDREIIWHWSKAFLTYKDMLQIMNEAPYKTYSIPSDLDL